MANLSSIECVELGIITQPQLEQTAEPAKITVDAEHLVHSVMVDDSAGSMASADGAQVGREGHA
ncbi:MAG TPA: hypothetical protein VF331_24370, partial [Polyangiales bacterium]